MSKKGGKRCTGGLHPGILDDIERMKATPRDALIIPFRMQRSEGLPLHYGLGWVKEVKCFKRFRRSLPSWRQLCHPCHSCARCEAHIFCRQGLCLHKDLDTALTSQVF
eukprot:1160165-Pelagomonas_calceolata.AAC.8